MNPDCPLCRELIDDDDRVVPTQLVTADGVQEAVMHQECALRSVMGGIGHHLDHDLWCTQREDPDGGLTYRESARAVWRLVHREDSAGAGG
jgi:hypothetical protein